MTSKRYRYVEQRELADLEDCKTLRAGPNSCGPGKWIAESREAAWLWGAALDGDPPPGRVVVLAIPQEVLDRSERNPSLDGIGPAAYIDEDDLALVAVLEVLEWNP